MRPFSLRNVTNLNSDQLVERAVGHFMAGDSLAAEIDCREALIAQPRHREARVLLAGVMHAQGRYGEAEQLFGALADEEPAEPAHWMNLGTVRRLAGRLDDALAAFGMAVRLGPMSAELAFNLGLLHLDRKDHVSARAVLARAAELEPRDAEIRLELAEACNAALDTDAAVTALRGWEDFEGLDVDILAKIGRLLVTLGEPGLAEPALHRVAEEATRHPRAGLMLVGIYERTNRIDDARELFARLEAQPHGGELEGEFSLARAQLAARESRHEEATRAYRQLVERTNQLHERHHHLFPLARELDALGRYDEAWQALREAHRSQVASLELTAPGLLIRGATTMEITQYGCDPSDVAAWNHDGAPDVRASPIFIVAFPRSGTTLLELTLDAHPHLRSMDEQPFLQNVLDDVMSIGVRYPERLAALTAAQLAEIRQNYWQRVQRKVQLAPGQRLVDKNPLNLLRLPVIVRVFPNARVILAVRDPRDVLLSCTMQHFRAPDFAMLCRDLPTLALGYRRAFDFWYAQTALLPVAVREVRYEKFVADLEPEVRALATFLELPWSDALLEPAAHARRKAFISTPSYSQVVQPVTTRAVGRYARYAAQFVEVEDLLQPYLTRWSYA